MTTFNRTVSDNADFQNLVALLDEDLKTRDGDEHAFYAQFNKTQNLNNVIICYIDKKPESYSFGKNYDAFRHHAWV